MYNTVIPSKILNFFNVLLMLLCFTKLSTGDTTNTPSVDTTMFIKTAMTHTVSTAMTTAAVTSVPPIATVDTTQQSFLVPAVITLGVLVVVLMVVVVIFIVVVVCILRKNKSVAIKGDHCYIIYIVCCLYKHKLWETADGKLQRGSTSAPFAFSKSASLGNSKEDQQLHLPTEQNPAYGISQVSIITLSHNGNSMHTDVRLMTVISLTSVCMLFPDYLCIITSSVAQGVCAAVILSG